MAIHPVVEEILTTRRVTLADGSAVDAHSFIPRESCDLLYDVVRETRASRAIEVGMAYGISTVCLADALRQTAGAAAHHIAVDPMQTTQWGGGALSQVARAGLSDVVELVELPSHIALPQLLARGERVQVGFIDGWHTFDHTLIDFFYIDQMLEPGGIIVLDDAGYPAIKAVARFILANRSYTLERVLEHDDTASTSQQARRRLKRVLRRFARTDRDPSSASEALFSRIALAHTVALRKTADDTRRFDHFERF
jgi:predicted O-methyltransferase YrrM